MNRPTAKWILSTVAAAFADPDVDAVYGDLCYVDPVDTTRVIRYWRSSPFRPGLFARGWAPPHPTLYVRRETYEDLLARDLAVGLVLLGREGMAGNALVPLGQVVRGRIEISDP